MHLYFAACVIGRFEQLDYKALNILRRDPCCAESNIYFGSRQVIWLYLLQSFHVSGIFGVVYLL